LHGTVIWKNIHEKQPYGPKKKKAICCGCRGREETPRALGEAIPGDSR